MTGKNKRERIYDRCVYRDCKSHRIKTNAHLFRFPSKDDPRLEYWVQSTANPRLKSWRPSTLRNAGVCSLHFAPIDITVNGRLKYGSYPIPYFDALNAKITNDKIAQSNDSSRNCATSPNERIMLHPEPNQETQTTKVSEVSIASSEKLRNSLTARTTKIVDSTSAKITKIEDSAIVRTNETVNTLTTKNTKMGDALTLKTNKENDRFSPVEVTEPKYKYEKRVDFTFVESDDEDTSWMAMEPEPELAETSMNDATHVIDSEEEAINDIILIQLESHNKDLKRLNTKLLAKVAKYQKLNQQLGKKLRRAMLRNAVLVEKSKKKTVDEFLDENGCVEPAARTMVKLQLHRKNAPFADDEKNLARQLFCYSAPAYKRLIQAGCSFPAVSTVRLWITENDSKPEPCPVIDEK